MTKNLSFMFLILILSSCGNNSQDKSLTKSSVNTSVFSGTNEVPKVKNDSIEKYEPGFTIDIKLTPFIPDYRDLGQSGRQLLATRLTAVLSSVGFSGEGANPRFIIGPDINLLSKNITSSSPTKYANTFEVTLLAADIVSETVFANYTFKVKGIGDSPDKAFINALREYNFNNKAFFEFLKLAQDKIGAFYDKNCESFILQAESEAKMRNYDAAFTILNNIPVESSKCFKSAIEKKSKYLQMSLNSNCQSILSSMKAELGKANDPSASGFNEEAMAYYSLLDRQSSCYSEAEKIYQGYMKKLNPKAKRDWEFSMQKYQDQIAKMNKLDQIRQDSVISNFKYLTLKEELTANAESVGNKKLMQKYQYDELPWIRKIFHLGKYDPFDRIDK